LFPVGFAYLDFDRTSVAHLWILIAQPHPEPDERVIVSVTSDGPHVTDRACELAPGDHEFIKHRSFVVFRKASIVTVGDLQSWASRGNVNVKAAASPALVDRIREEALRSPFTSRRVQAAIRDCWWTP